MKKITILATNLYYGGIEKYLSVLCGMLENYFSIELIVTYKFQEKPAFYFSDKINIRYLIEDNPNSISMKKLIREGHFIKAFKEIFHRHRLKYLDKKLTIKALKELDSDYIITTRTYHNELVNKYLKNSEIIKIATEHNHHNNDEKYINSLIKSVSNFDYMIQCSEDLYQFYKRRVVGPKVVKIPNFIHIDDDRLSELNNRQIISVGRLSSEKGFLDLIDVIAYVKNNWKNPKDFKLVLCGDGYQKDAIVEKIKSNHLEDVVEMKGFITGKPLYDLYSSSSLYVMPSISESFGLVILEAMHFGLPVIAFDSASGARELLKDDNGVLISDRDISKMGDAIIALLSDKKRLSSYQKKSLSVASEYDVEVIKKEWLKLLNND